ncbi:MAG: class II fumarate hydratase [Nitrososphaerota archaeon]|nr:class II fumarate hydratase [Nitrososphaerota archaeon]MDG6931575.1 class II fumarate hydratase [Nitrososphaerota archaeon]MDG6936007.1 class II fumarate hydratase [Nitrososphaerota archaeon]MDG6943939.1 class II fumarate hydratase [Nitrososphaerota archaeon]
MSYTEHSKRVFLNTGTRFQRSIIWSMGAVKLAAARANVLLGIMGQDMGQAIEKAALELMDGLHDEEITVDVFQTGSGTGINMNVNEVISKRASEILGSKVHPNDHVNMSQSSNDVVPTAIRVAAARDALLYLIPSLKELVSSLNAASQKASDVYKPGRTHLRDALPVTLGQEFGAYATAFERDSQAISASVNDVKVLPIGATAVGTGINSPIEFSKTVVKEVNKIIDLGYKVADNRFMRMRLLTDLVNLSGAIRGTSLDLYRLSQDLRLMFSGPMTGINEIDIPSQEEVAGSSIMPGKINPVTVESCLQSSVQIMGIDHAVQLAGMLGEFELSMGVPLTGYDVILEIALLSESLTKMAKVVIDNVVPNRERSKRLAESSPSLITIISPYIGYDKASKIGKQLAKGLSLRDALKELGYKDNEIDTMLDMKKLVKGGFVSKQ